MLAQLPGTIKELQFLLMSWLAGTFPMVQLTKAPRSSSRDITAATTVTKADINSNCFSKSLILSKQPKRISSMGKWSKISMIDSIFWRTKHRSATQLVHIILKNLERLYLIQLHILRNWVHVSSIDIEGIRTVCY